MGEQGGLLAPRERSFNPPVLSEIGEHLYTKHHIPAPAIARLIPLLDAILL